LILTGTAQSGGTGNGLNNTITGNDAANTLMGLGGRDTLMGGEGEDSIDGGKSGDMLIGGKGADALTGGKGADNFVFKEPGGTLPGVGNHDTVTDFSHDQGDLIDLSLMDADTTQSGNQNFVLGGNAFTGMAGELIQFIHAISGDTILQGDVGGDGIADFEIALKDGPVLVAADFAF